MGVGGGSSVGVGVGISEHPASPPNSKPKTLNQASNL
jgi:hypothetical protein